MLFRQNKHQTTSISGSHIVVGSGSMPSGAPEWLRAVASNPRLLWAIGGVGALLLSVGVWLLVAAHNPNKTDHMPATASSSSQNEGQKNSDTNADTSTDEPSQDTAKDQPTAQGSSGGTSGSGSGGTGSSSGSSGGSSGGGSSGGSTNPCAGSAHHIAGGADGTGSCWPGSANTGVPAGTALSTYSGPCTITANNTIISAKTVNCDLSIQAANVLIKNSKVNGNVILDVDLPGSNAWSMTIQDSEVDAGPRQTSAVGWGNVTVLRSNLHGGQNALQCEEKSLFCTVQDSYLHGQYLPDDEPWHLGGFLSDGGQNMTFTHNYIACDHAQNSLGEGCTGDLNFIPNFAAIDGALVEHNLFGANIDSSYCTYGGEKFSSPTPHSYNIVYKDNVFQRGSNNKCGAYGPVTNFEISNTGNQWINNRWDDGSVVDPAN